MGRGERKPQPLQRAKVEQAIESLEGVGTGGIEAGTCEIAQKPAQKEAQILHNLETDVQNQHIPEGEPAQTKANPIRAEEECSYNVDTSIVLESCKKYRLNTLTCKP